MIGALHQCVSAVVGPIQALRMVVLAQFDRAESIEEVLELSWPIPIWATVVIGLLTAAGIAAIYLSERGKASRSARLLLALVRFSILALVLWMIAGWSWQRFKTDKPELVIALDRSASMATRDGNGPDAFTALGNAHQSDESPTRFVRAARILSQLSAREIRVLEQRYRFRWVTLAESFTTIDVDLSDVGSSLSKLTPDGQQSKLGDALASLLQWQTGRPTAAIVLLSDGITTGGRSLPDAANKARMSAIPIYAVALGQQRAQPDVRLTDLLVDDAVFLGDEVNLQATLIGADVGHLAARVALVNAATSEVLDAVKTELSDSQNRQQIRLRFVPLATGDIAIRLQADRAAGESNVDNNVLERTISVRDQSIRVLLVQRSPSFEFRFLKNMLERSTQPGNAEVAAFEVESVLQEADASYVDQDDTAIRLIPSDRESLAKYDVFVMGDFDPALIGRSSQSAIADQIAIAGSGLMLICGRDFSPASLRSWPLTNILPVEFTSDAESLSGGDSAARFAWRPTPLGESALPLQLAAAPAQSLDLWQRLPGPEWIARLGESKPAAQVLASAQPLDSPTGIERPLLVSHFAGAGRVAIQATDETYRWTSFAGGDVNYQRYWGQMIRWLSRGRLSRTQNRSQLVVEPRSTKFGEPVRVTARLGTGDSIAAPSACRVRLEQLDGTLSTLALPRVNGSANQFLTTKSDLPPGSYRAVLSEPALGEPPSATFTVIAPPGEQANLKADRKALKEAADVTRGKFYLAEEAATLFRDLPAGNAMRLGSLPPKPLWNSPYVALAFILLLTGEWLLRRACRMF